MILFQRQNKIGFRVAGEDPWLNMLENTYSRDCQIVREYEVSVSLSQNLRMNCVRTPWRELKTHTRNQCFALITCTKIFAAVPMPRTPLVFCCVTNVTVQSKENLIVCENKSFICYCCIIMKIITRY